MFRNSTRHVFNAKNDAEHSATLIRKRTQKNAFQNRQFGVVLCEIRSVLDEIDIRGYRRSAFNILMTIVESKLSADKCCRLVLETYLIAGMHQKERNDLKQQEMRSRVLKTIQQYPEAKIITNGPKSNEPAIREDDGFSAVEHRVNCAAKEIIILHQAEHVIHLRNVIAHMSKIGQHGYTHGDCMKASFKHFYTEYVGELTNSNVYGEVHEEITRILNIHDIPHDTKRNAFELLHIILGSGQPADKCYHLVLAAYVIVRTPQNERLDLNQTEVNTRVHQIIKEYSEGERNGPHSPGKIGVSHQITNGPHSPQITDVVHRIINGHHIPDSSRIVEV